MNSLQTHALNCAVILPVGPGHQNLVEQAKSSVQEAIHYSKGPFTQVEICTINDSTGEHGPAKARNIAIDSCREQGFHWLLFLDVDDLACQDAFHAVSEYIEEYDAIWGSIFEMQPGQTTAVIKPGQIHCIHSIEQLLHYDDPSLALHMGHFVKTSVAAQIRFDESLRACEEIDHVLKLWKACRCVKVRNPLCLTRRGKESQRLAQAQREQIAAFIVRKYRYGLDEFLDGIPTWSHAYQTESTNQDVLEKLLTSRRRLCEHYLRLPEDTFRTELEMTQEAYFSLMRSGMRAQALSEDEQEFISGLLEQDCNHPQSTQYLLTLFLYCLPHQMPEQWRSQLSLPKWASRFLHAWFNRGKVTSKQQRRWKIVNGLEIEGVPPDFDLPPIVGENNDYSFLEKQCRAFVDSGKPYTLGVSIVIPVYNRKKKLAKTLAAITHQTYPKNFIEVIVADDGSSDGVEAVIEKYQAHLSLKYVRQEDKGYRLSAARNLGMEAAQHEYIALLDCDMLPEPEYIELFMQYFHISDRAVLIGHRCFVCTDDISDDQILENINVALDLPDIMSGNEHLRTKHDKASSDPRFIYYTQNDYLKEGVFSSFSPFYGGSVAYPKTAIQRVGPFDEAFQEWGCEDTEMGYRLYNAGYYFIPVLKAVALHQEPPGGENETNREQGRTVTRELLEQKCPAPTYRAYQPNIIYDVPKVSIYIPAYNAKNYIKPAVDSVLAQSYTDLEVCIVNDGSTDNTIQVLEQHYPNNPRVRWISQTHQGIAKASNTAVNMCRGMYIAQLDADDTLLRLDAVEILVNHLDTHNVGCVYSKCYHINEHGLFLRKGDDWPKFSREKLMSDMIVQHFRMFRKREWMRTAGFDEALESAVDYDMYLQLSEVCSFYHIDEMLYGYRWHGKNISVVGKEEQAKCHITCLQNALKRTGLDDTWTIHAPDPQQPRHIIFRRKAKQ